MPDGDRVYVCYACSRVAQALIHYAIWFEEPAGPEDEPDVMGTRTACHVHHSVRTARRAQVERLAEPPCDCVHHGSGSMAPERVSDEGAIH